MARFILLFIVDLKWEFLSLRFSDCIARLMADLFFLKGCPPL